MSTERHMYLPSKKRVTPYNSSLNWNISVTMATNNNNTTRCNLSTRSGTHTPFPKWQNPGLNTKLKRIERERERERERAEKSDQDDKSENHIQWRAQRYF